jgi:PAS domain S-box-containing protein
MKGRQVSTVDRKPNSGSRQLIAEKLGHLYSNQKLGHVATLINAVILVVIQWKQVSHAVLYAWLGLILVIISGRIFLARQFYCRYPTPPETHFWGNLFLAGIFATGSAWGLAGIFLLPGGSDAHQMFTAFTIGGMVAGASAVFASFRSALFAFSLPAMLPMIVYFLTFQDEIHIGMSVMSTLFLVLMIGTGLRNNKVIDATIKLRFEKQGLLDYLAEAKNRAESINTKLQVEINERRRMEQELEKHQKQLESEVEKRTAQLRERNQELKFEIQERSRAEAALRDSEERYRLLIENTIVGIMVISDERIVFANAFVCHLSGYSRDQILGQPFIEFIHPDDRQLAMTNHWKRLNNEVFADSYPIRMLDSKKEVRWLEVSAVRLSYENKPAVLVFMRDISRQRKLESQLFQNEKMASIGQLAAGVAHEINNPVGFVNSNLHTLGGYQKDMQQLIACYQELLAHLKSSEADSGREPLLQKISAIERLEAEMDLDFILADSPQLIHESQEGTERIKNIVLDLKDFAHPGSERVQLIDVNKSIESTLNIVWNELKYNATVIKEFGKIPQIQGYPQQLNQVFMNLLVNAAQAIKEKGEIKIQTRQTDGKVEVSISDTGCGIPEENLKKVFDPFFTTKPVGKGTGLGLNVSFNIIKKHNGTIQATSKLAQGTTFTIQLPVEPIQEAMPLAG